ncbi:hypothetical protein T552_00047 [Pneumocystis carinii B80]|uniref:Ino eighty subunit 1 n=1 Tax=Pneumocystis carinii (strain B80) TaxID=1408658 RepID=A0A0W4ZSP7_PNEC8|nr:hypothetical protein T552_00047 [Pneumocystis carinii B80]KTW31402.1 hypothetical protein T552_00047 [Pneumocystis carinii B80]
MNDFKTNYQENIQKSSSFLFSPEEEAKEQCLLSYTPKEKIGYHSSLKGRFLKKKEGEALLRQDIQYAFLNLVVNNDKAVFTLPQGTVNKKVTFGELYVEYIRRSPKASKVLREKLENDKMHAMALVMIALLVNIGRINTTLVFTHTQTRTYNPVPSLQAYSNDKVKVLQDAPRLKGILKFYSEDLPEHLAWQSLLNAQKSQLRPCTNPINLIFIFVLCSSRISNLHFDPSFEFIDLFIKPTFSSESRARAFLWLCWHYLETDGSSEVATRNPFNYGYNENPLSAPALKSITEEEAAEENVDTPTELEYAVKMAEERKKYLQESETLRNNSQDMMNFRRKSRTRKTHKKDDADSSPEFSKFSSIENQDENFENTARDNLYKKQYKSSDGAKKRKVDDAFYNSIDEEKNHVPFSYQQTNSNTDVIEKQKYQPKKTIKKQFIKNSSKNNSKKRRRDAIQREWKKYESFSPLEDSNEENDADQDEYAIVLLASLNRAYRRATKHINQKRFFSGKKAFDWNLSQIDVLKESKNEEHKISIQQPVSEHTQVGGKTLPNLIRMGYSF